MKYVSIAESRAGSDKESPKPRKQNPSAPRKSADESVEIPNPDGGPAASKPEEADK